MPGVLFLNLSSFSKTGGIESFNKCLLKALNDPALADLTGHSSCSLMDMNAEPEYYPPENYAGFAGERWTFLFKSIWQARKYDLIILGHINLSIPGCLIHFIFPRKKIVLIAHGLEVWEPVGYFKSYLLRKANKIWAVSNFTLKKLSEIHFIPNNKIKLIPNCIPVDFIPPQNIKKPEYLLKRYNIESDTKILLTVCRICFNEQYKGYDAVIKSLSKYKNESKIRYFIAGSGDDKEIKRVKSLISQYQLDDVVTLLGFITKAELRDHYQLADVFVMPSKKEGFGIVYIESMACGTPVIAGNKDGSADALMNGEMGLLIDPDDSKSLIDGINYLLANKPDPYFLQKKVRDSFGYDFFKIRIRELVRSEM